MFQEFPYTDMHQLNLDWIIKIAKDFLDQYTHIQEVISNGEESLQNLTTEGLQQLQDKTDALEAALQAWYNEHSEDIANQLTQALADLNEWYNNHSEDIADQLTQALADLNDWYNSHSQDIADQLTTAIASFNSSAEAKSQALLDSWPDDYSELVTECYALKTAVFAGNNNLIDSKVIYSNGNSSVINNNDGTYTIGTTDYGSTVFDRMITLKPGAYKLFGVPNGYSFLSTIAHKNGAFVTNEDSSPLIVTITTETNCYVGFNIDVAPASSFTIAPFLYETIMEKNEKNISEIIAIINESIHYLGQATGTTIASNETPGWYSVDTSIVGNFTDLPDGASVGDIVNISRAGNVSKRYVKQFYINAIDGKSWQRLLINGTAYNSWVRYILGTEYDDFKSSVLKYNGEVSGTTLVSNLITGWYAVTSSVIDSLTDKPDGAEIGTLLNIPRSGNTSVNNIRQFYINGLNGRIWSRHVANGSIFRDWQCVGAGSYNVIWYALGDSITAGVYSNDQGEPVTVYNPPWAYPNQVARDYKCTVHNLGNPGKAITEYGPLLTNIHSDATLVTITGGANDYANETNPLGDVNSTKDYTTVCGALKSIIETVASTAPNARIVLVSPFLIKYGSAATKWSLNYAVSNKGNFTYDQLSNAMKAIAEYYNIEFIDGTHTGPVNILNIGNVLKDNVHPTKVFYDTISNWIGSKLF